MGSWCKKVGRGQVEEEGSGEVDEGYVRKQERGRWRREVS